MNPLNQFPEVKTHSTVNLVLMGTSGCGKTTVAKMLHEWGWHYIEGDNFHPQSNREKMLRGEALTDEDRWPWLENLRLLIGLNTEREKHTVLTCSALKKSYREILAKTQPTCFVLLSGSKDLLQRRLELRSSNDSNISPTLLQSQLDTLESLGKDEAGITINLDALGGDSRLVMDEIVNRLLRQLMPHSMVMPR